MKVTATQEVIDYLNELVDILYEKGYFGFEENAHRYVDELVANIRADLPFKVKKPVPPYFDRYGKDMWYASFRKNRGTQWYVFFTVYRKDDEIVYLVRYIANNHTVSQYL